MAMLVAAAGVALAIPPSLSPVLAGLMVFGAAIPWMVTGIITLAQRLTPPDLQGRVYAATEAVITTPQTFSIAVGAALITMAGYQALLGAMAVIFAAVAAWLLTRPEQRRRGIASSQASAEAGQSGDTPANQPAGTAERPLKGGHEAAGRVCRGGGDGLPGSCA